MTEVECSKLDRISNLQQDIIGYILTLMPLKDALRTSILSRKWRYKWASITKLHIDCKTCGNSFAHRSTITNAIFHMLLLLKSPHGKKGKVEIKSIAQEDKLTFVELFKSSAIEQFLIEKYYMENFDTLNMPPKLPISLVHLKWLYLGVYFMEKDELLCVLGLIKSSPNLMRLDLKNEQPDDFQPITMASFDIQDHSDLKVDLLDEFRMKNFSNLIIEMELLKLIVAQSPVLKKVRIVLNENFPVDEELQIFKDPFPRASPFVKFVVERPKTFSPEQSYDFHAT